VTIVSELKTLVSYYGAKLTDAQIDLYIAALSDISADDLHTAIVELIKTSKWMPKVSEIRAAAEVAQINRSADETQLWKARNIPDQAPWLRVGPANISPEFAPAVIEWQDCHRCGLRFANWSDCPDCNTEAV